MTGCQQPGARLVEAWGWAVSGRAHPEPTTVWACLTVPLACPSLDSSLPGGPNSLLQTWTRQLGLSSRLLTSKTVLNIPLFRLLRG